MKKRIFIISIIVLILDQLSKIIANMYLTLGKSIKVINNFFYLSYVYNEGAAWSILKTQRLLLILIGFIALFLVYSFIKDFEENKRNILSFGRWNFRKLIRPNFSRICKRFLRF